MDKLIISDLRDYDVSDQGASGRMVRLARFLGEIVSASSVMTSGEFQTSSLKCRRRPNRRPCKGHIRLGRDPDTDEIHWSCASCNDRGVITHWHQTSWDLSQEVESGHIVSLSEERARRAGRLHAAEPQLTLELEVDLIHAPIPLEGPITRRVRLNDMHTLQDLHHCLHLAFDRLEEEPYEFMFGAPYDPQARRIVGAVDPSVEGEAALVRLSALKLKQDDTFGYLFDFTEEWIHRVTVVNLGPMSGPHLDPQVIARQGESPPQLQDLEAWDEDLLWDELEPPSPLTSLYGIYQADKSVVADDWLALDDLERQLVVIEAHTHSLPSRHLPITSMLFHAVLHDLAEMHLAQLGKRKATRRVSSHPLIGEGRHAVIHALGAELARDLLELHGCSAPTKTNTNRPRRAKPPGHEPELTSE